MGASWRNFSPDNDFTDEILSRLEFEDLKDVMEEGSFFPLSMLELRLRVAPEDVEDTASGETLKWLAEERCGLGNCVRLVSDGFKLSTESR